MSQSKKRAPVQLAGITKGGHAPDGDSIKFTLDAQDGREFTFSVPHEAVGEIVALLLHLAGLAAAVRPGDLPADGDPHRIERSYPLERFLVSRTEESQLVLTMYARGIQHAFLLQREHAQALSSALADALRRTTN